MKQTTPEIKAALKAGTLSIRDFIWLEAVRISDGATIEWGAWSDVGNFSAPVIDAYTQETVTRAFEGAGGLIETSPISLVSGLAVQTVEVKMSQVNPDVEAIVRGYSVRRSPIQIYRGFFNPGTYQMIAPAVPRFAGFIDDAPINTPPEGQEGAISFMCVSRSQDLTRRSTSKRSDADQRRRDPNDGFFSHASSVGTWTIKWNETD